jgi:ABC-2 type transport system ATP-binding protein
MDDSLPSDVRPGDSGEGPVEPAVRLRGVRKRFGYRDVLRGVNLEIPRGAVFVLFGPNGAGKSTLLRVIATQWAFDSGEVRVLGLDVRKQAVEVRARVGVVFHESFLRRELTLEENLRFAGDLHGIPRGPAQERIGELLDRFELGHRRGDLVKTFSQGMARRADLARSLLHEPEIWVLDEPFSGLDAEGQAILESAVREFAARRTVILVTHLLERGRQLAGHSAWVEDGAILAAGPAATALDAHGAPSRRKP